MSYQPFTSSFSGENVEIDHRHLAVIYMVLRVLGYANPPVLMQFGFLFDSFTMFLMLLVGSGALAVMGLGRLGDGRSRTDIMYEIVIVLILFGVSLASVVSSGDSESSPAFILFAYTVYVILVIFYVTKLVVDFAFVALTPTDDRSDNDSNNDSKYGMTGTDLVFLCIEISIVVYAVIADIWVAMSGKVDGVIDIMVLFSPVILGSVFVLVSGCARNVDITDMRA